MVIQYKLQRLSNKKPWFNNTKCALIVHNGWYYLHLPVGCLPTLQLTLPEGTLPRFAHTVTACAVCPGVVHATTFGGCPKYVYGDDAKEKLANTTVMEFSECNMHCAMLVDAVHTRWATSQ